ncbi:MULTISPECIES: CdaR family protein [Thermodesulfovibrio]|uniref:CdaR family protein n=1 Tax=Thermodesulfovibrio TaxID=28261 RepID=UPI0026248511|nr:CdaR family protein [Thermodesulfovibrio sp.]
MNRFMRKMLTENTAIKVISIMISLFLWFFVTFKGQTETSIEVPLELKNTPAEMEVLRQSVRKITVSISARERILKDIAQNDVRVIVDISNVKLGENSIPITKSSVKLPRGVEILRIDPSTVKLFVDKKEQKNIPVKAVITGKPEKGFVIDSVEVTPSNISIEGAKRELDRIRIIKTEPIDIEGLNNNLTIQAKIDPEGKIFRAEKDTVNVTVRLRRH